LGVIDRICAPWSLALAGYLQVCFWSALVERLVSFVFELMSGLKLAWHRRRTTRRLRADFMLVHKLLSANLGRGHYSYAHFRTAPAVRTDASKQARYSGGGWVSACGAFVWFKYGSRAARLPARHRRGVRRAAGAQVGLRGAVLHRQLQLPEVGGQGAVQDAPHRLNDLLRELLALMIKFGFVITWTWIATEENVDADHLSRGRVDEYCVREGRVDFNHRARAHARYRPHSARGAGHPGRRLGGAGACAGGGGGGGGRVRFTYHTPRLRSARSAPASRSRSC
jgi:hypothetical protein